MFLGAITYSLQPCLESLQCLIKLLFLFLKFPASVFISQEKHVKERQIKHWKEIIVLQDKLKACLAKMETSKAKVADLHKQYSELEKEKGRDVSKEFAFRSKQRDLQVSRKETPMFSCTYFHSVDILLEFLKWKMLSELLSPKRCSNLILFYIPHQCPPVHRIYFHVLLFLQQVSLKAFDKLAEEKETLTRRLQEMDAHPPSEVYLSSRSEGQKYAAFLPFSKMTLALVQALTSYF